MNKTSIIIYILLSILQPTILLGQNISDQNAKADSLTKAKDFNGAITIYRQMLDQHPEDVDIRLNLGKAYYLSGDYEKAENELSEVIRQAPKYEDAYEILANVYFASNKNNLAISELGRLYKVNPARKDLLLKIFLTAVDDKEYTVARSYYKTITSLNAGIEIPEQYVRKIMQWEVGLYYGTEFVTNSSNWQDITLGTSYKFDNDVTIAGGYQNFKRFDNNNDMLSLSTYFALPQKIAWYINAGFSPKPDFLPKERIDITMQPYLPEGFSLLGSYSYLFTSYNNVSIFSAGLEKYILPEINLSYQYIYGIIENTDQKSHAHLLKLNWYRSNFRATLGYSKGSELWDSPNTLFTFSVDTYSIFMNSNIWISSSTAINLNLAYTDRINNYAQRRIGAGLVYKF
jgi:YaiO family outer membrane protein